MDVREVWHRLRSIKELIFEAQSSSATKTGWTGSGSGSVHVEQTDPFTMLFLEKGFWTTERSSQIAFTNVFRWILDPDGKFIRLEHLRFGPELPVYLFDLIPVVEGVLESAEPHACRDDCYSAQLKCVAHVIHLNWAVTGPKKDERISYSYW